MPINPLLPLLDLDGCNFRLLSTVLQQDQAWRKVAEFLPIFDRNEILALSLTTYPSESLLNKLGTKLWKIRDLAYVLRKCVLYDALLIVSDPEPMQIVSQPTDIHQGKDKLSMRIGDLLELNFDVVGIPPPKFQWFKDDQILGNQVAAVLRYECFEPGMEGKYFCRATQEAENQITSRIIEVETLPVACTVLEAPDECVYLCEGSAVLLKLKVVAYPKPNFQWLHGNTVLDNETKDTLFIQKAYKNHSGEYRCHVSNKANEVVVKVNLIIYEENIFKTFNEPVPDKIALLIANNNYENQDTLTSPPQDVCTVAKILQTLGFKTICLQNLNLHELKTAIEVFANSVQEKCFAFFYYAGHGFEIGDKFLVPTDCPNVSSFKKSDAVSESMILQPVLNKNPALFVYLLDMCLQLPSIAENPAIYEETAIPLSFKSNRNLIRGYSTTSHLASYEKEGKRNGVYISTLEKYLGEDLPILTILGKVNADISAECPEQMPSIFYITAQDFYLNNAVQGFYEHENRLFAALNINDEEACLNGAKIRLSKHKGVFNNSLDIILNGVNTVEYVLNSTKVDIAQVVEHDNVTLKVMNLQKLGATPLSVKLKIDSVEFNISNIFKIGNIFLDV